jgi:hypothetical protein
VILQYGDTDGFAAVFVELELLACAGWLLEQEDDFTVQFGEVNLEDPFGIESKLVSAEQDYSRAL